MVSAPQTIRTAALGLMVAASTTLSGCFVPHGCNFQGTELYPVSDPGVRLLAVNTSDNGTLLEAFGHSAFTLSLEFPGDDMRREYRMDFNATGVRGPGLYSSEFAWRHDRADELRVASSDPGVWHPFQVRLDVNSSDPEVQHWVFFGGDNIVGGRYSVSADRLSITVESADLPFPTTGGEVAVADDLWVGIRSHNICA